MPQQNCTIVDCPNHGKYCRQHHVETFTPVNKIDVESDKRKRLNRIYRIEAKRFIASHPKCQVEGCKHDSSSVHHKAGRIGDLLLKENGYSESRLAI